jgi:hypothetical protein
MSSFFRSGPIEMAVCVYTHVENGFFFKKKKKRSKHKIKEIITVNIKKKGKGKSLRNCSLLSSTSSIENAGKSINSHHWV